MAAKKQIMKVRRTGPSPAVRKLQAALQASKKGAAALRAKVKESSSGQAALIQGASSASGAAVAGVVDSALGGGIVSKGARGGLGAALIVAGGFAVPGKLGSILASIGCGMTDSLAYEGGQYLGDMVFSGDDGDDGGDV
jgi:hypothetical protein